MKQKFKKRETKQVMQSQSFTTSHGQIDGLLVPKMD